MAITDNEVLEALQRSNAKQIQLAGQRYTPGVEPGAPNLKIAPLLLATDSVACGPQARERFVQFASALRDAWGHAKQACEDSEAIQAKIDALEATVDALLPRVRARDGAALSEWKDQLAAIAAPLESERERWRTEERKAIERESAEPKLEHRTYSSQRDSIRSNINEISQCIGMLSDEQEFIGSTAGKVLVDPFLLVRGSWGTGKTHLLCDVTLHRGRQGRPTLFILAKSFQGTPNLLPLIAGEVLAGATPEELVDHLQRLGAARNERALIIVDGVNEGRRAEWRRAIGALAALVRDRTHVGLIVSCRTPFERASIAQADLARFHEITHRGFEDQEFDAQAAFFLFYKLPLPEVPLLDAEFSRPLTLKLICQSLRNLTGKKLREGFSGIASGQRGMTYVLESFVNRVGESIEREFALPPKACWWLVKGSPRIADQRAAGFAPNMAAMLREYVRPSDARRIIAAHFPALTAERRRALLDALRTGGLLDEDVLWSRAGKDVKSRTVYRLPYQRFSDHLVARHLLDKYLDTSSETAVRKSLARGSPLGRVFRRGRYSQAYAHPGWAQALMTEFPERVKKRIPGKRRELIFFVPHPAQRPSLCFEPFVEGLFWRDPAAFTEGTRRVINACLGLNWHDAWDRVVDALVAIATKPKHPYHARRLYRFLAGFSMPERDLRWSEYMRRRYSSPSVRRLLAWADRLERGEMGEDVARELVVLFSLVLTVTVRRDRDVATRALLVIGERYPRLLFEHAVESLSFNDPYVAERLLAAAYGVAMSRVDDPSGREFLQHLGWLARELYRRMFTPRARHQTHHALRRDYALGIIRLAERARVQLPLAARHNLSAPFSQIRSPFPDISSVSEDIHATGKFAIRMDFGNYTLGRLIRHRANYDDKNPEYQKVRAQIEWRIHNLGFREERFKEVDSEIGRSSFSGERDGNRVDRYGKKYSWIAYFEMYGVRESDGALSEWRRAERTSDCDIDPSFPKPPSPWTPPIPAAFDGTYTELPDWLRNGPSPDFRPLLRLDAIDGQHGPWVLLDGRVDSKDRDRGFELWALLRGLFMKRAEIPRLRDLYLKIEYPGNDAIPRSGEDYYVFAGEVGRSPRYAPELIRADGSYRRQTAEAFEEHRWIREPGQDDPVEEPKAPKDDDKDMFQLIVRMPRGRSARIPGVRVEVPVRSFSWETYHSAMNQFTGFDVPAPSVIEKLGLRTKNREIDFYDETDRRATIYRQSAADEKLRTFRLLYLREDLLKRYLQLTRQTLVWCNWGERDMLRGDGPFGIDAPPEAVEVFRQHRNIHRRFDTLMSLVK
jgi:hypothetical protein